MPASSSDPVGVNEYASSSSTEVDGVPVMVGASLTLDTVILNEDKLAVAVPSLTVITISLSVPTLLLFGVPVNAPVAVSKLAHVGVPVIEYTRVVPASSSDPVGVNE